MKPVFVGPLVLSAALLVAGDAVAQMPPVVRVHIATKAPVVVLEALNGRVWEEVCHAPCDRQVVKSATYRVTGPGIRTSDKLAFASGDDVWLTVATGSEAVHVAGVALAWFGVGGVGLGLNVLLAAALTESCSNCVAGFADTTTLNIGWTIVAAGAALLFVGLPMLASGTTSVWVSAKSPLTPDDNTPLIDVPLIRPVRDVESRAPTLPNGAVGFPVLTVKF